MIFVFGSNEAGIHGAGAARVAVRQHRAQHGVGFGPQGNSFAIPTKDWLIETLPIETIEHYIGRFIVYARIMLKRRPEIQFQVTAIGCGLAGLRHDVIAPMFKYAPQNCLFDEVWTPYLPKTAHFWGTYPS
jgi:hypothetical protein